LAGIAAMISALYFSPIDWKNRTASSRLMIFLSTGRSFFTISAIRFSIAPRSSGVKGRLYEKS
jgi:hypothetical protein